MLYRVSKHFTFCGSHLWGHICKDRIFILIVHFCLHSEGQMVKHSPPLDILSVSLSLSLSLFCNQNIFEGLLRACWKRFKHLSLVLLSIKFKFLLGGGGSILEEHITSKQNLNVSRYMCGYYRWCNVNDHEMEGLVIRNLWIQIMKVLP